MDDTQSALRVLIVEDSPADAELALRALREEIDRPIEHARVASEAALRNALAEFSPDVILSDFSMPGFSGQEALTIANEAAPHLPFLFVSGTIGEELAIEALQRGAIDYVLKDNLRRLPSAVDRALRIAQDRADRARIERCLRESEERFRSIVETSQDWIWEIDRKGVQTYSNPTVRSILGYAPEELIGQDSMEHMHPEDRAMVLRRLPNLMARGVGWSNWRLRWLHRDGSVRVLESHATPLLDPEGGLAGYRGIDHDVTEMLQQQERIHSLARLHGVLSALGSAILRSGSRHGVLHAACGVAVEHGGFCAAGIGEIGPDGALHMVGHAGEQKILDTLREIGQLTAGIEDPERMSPGMRVLRTGKGVLAADIASARVPEWVRTRLERTGVSAMALLPVGNPPTRVLGLYAASPQAFDDGEVALFERLAQEVDYALDFIAKGERLEFLAYHNQVTGLPNRPAFRDQLKTLLQGGDVAVAVLDVDRFGQINASRGRDFGDMLLCQIAERLQALTGPDVVIAHPEADDFALARRASTPEADFARLNTLVEEFGRTPFLVDGEEVYVDLRGGMARSPEHGADPETLKRNAKVALSESKRRGSRLYAYTDQLLETASRRMELERELRHAIDKGEFELHYQPKFDAGSNRLMSAEALLRWNHPRLGKVSPVEFIPILEQSGLIVPVGYWVMQTALGDALRWRALGHEGFHVCVNVSSRELMDSRFLEQTGALLQPHAGDQPIEIELTESVLMENFQHTVGLLETLRTFGCQIAIDDFGTGYSSLNYLARLPVDVLKIDRSFIALLTESSETMSLVTNIINLAHSLSLSVVAEGVETEEQAKMLRLLRCDLLQGYLLGRPEPAAQFEARLQANASG